MARCHGELPYRHSLPGVQVHPCSALHEPTAGNELAVDLHPGASFGREIHVFGHALPVPAPVVMPTT
jgi:hypothetical protein